MQQDEDWPDYVWGDSANWTVRRGSNGELRIDSVRLRAIPVLILIITGLWCVLVFAFGRSDFARIAGPIIGVVVGAMLFVVFHLDVRRQTDLGAFLVFDGCEFTLRRGR